ncbi:MAG TPA: hypothetical protein VK989_18585, partial [Polyangia bacterium]|nr:hypothetical protein [Polyangia bacterium]
AVADAASGDAADMKVTDATSRDAAATDAGGADGGDAHLPGVMNKLAVAGVVQLAGSGPDTCTNQVPATTDRWCAFAKPAATLGNFELWVIDVTKVAANVTVKCDTTDANCLRLSTGLYSDPTNGFRVEGFDGDTLTYSEIPTLSANGFIGAVSAWRPGWTAGRRLTSNAGVTCSGHRAASAAICIENPVTDANQNTTAELHAGLLDTQTGGTLPLVDTLLVFATTDANGVQKWNAKLTPDGASIAWSTRATASGTEDLKVQKIGDDASRVSVASDVSQWIVTKDSAEWLWLGGYNYDQGGAPSGTLQSAAFPAGTGVQTIAAAVGDFNEAGPQGVLYRSNVSTNAGKLVLAPDRDAPGTTTTLDQGVFFVFEVSQDGTRATYTKDVQSLDAGTSTVPIFDLWLATAGAAAPCALTATATGFLAPQFLSAADMTAWGRFNMLTGEVEGVYTTSADCVTRSFASDVFSWTPIGDEGYVFLDTLSPDPNVNEATLRYAKVANGLLPSTGTSIQARAGLAFATLLPSLSAVVYTVETGAAGDGLYVDAALPFTTSP